MTAAQRIEIKGIVQGVGFRPFVYNLALQYQLNGWVKNTSKGVIIEVEGNLNQVTVFLDQISELAPPLSHIDSIEHQEIEPNGHTGFQIIESESIPGAFVPISPDISICDDCRRELFDSDNPRFRYPFINCTNCGPRFSIIQNIPYDRPATSMAPFKMCAFCQNEYDDPTNRRFHAQPVACPDCGPHIWLEVNDHPTVEKEQALQAARHMLKEGKILAIKGLGGFHLACDASNDKAVKMLRERKKRTDKPFAVMVFDAQTAQHYTHIEPAEMELLTCKERPIVLLKKKNSSLSPFVAPGMISWASCCLILLCIFFY